MGEHTKSVKWFCFTRSFRNPISFPLWVVPFPNTKSEANITFQLRDRETKYEKAGIQCFKAKIHKWHMSFCSQCWESSRKVKFSCKWGWGMRPVAEKPCGKRERMGSCCRRGKKGLWVATGFLWLSEILDHKQIYQLDKINYQKAAFT